jgi:hypothetical protein
MLELDERPRTGIESACVVMPAGDEASRTVRACGVEA